MATKAHDVESIVDDFRYSTNVATAHVSIRLGFLRKVFGILSTQLLVTTVVGAIFMYTDGVKAYVQSSQGMLIVAYVSSIFLLLALFVKRRESPTNMILLALFITFPPTPRGWLTYIFPQLAPTRPITAM